MNPILLKTELKTQKQIIIEIIENITLFKDGKKVVGLPDFTIIFLEKCPVRGRLRRC